MPNLRSVWQDFRFDIVLVCIECSRDIYILAIRAILNKAKELFDLPNGGIYGISKAKKVLLISNKERTKRNGGNEECWIEQQPRHGNHKAANSSRHRTDDCWYAHNASAKHGDDGNEPPGVRYNQPERSGHGKELDNG